MSESDGEKSPNVAGSQSPPTTLFNVMHTSQCAPGHALDYLSSSSNNGFATPLQGTPPLGPRIAQVPLITPRYQKKSHTTRSMQLTDSFDLALTPTEALQQHCTENMVIRDGKLQYEQQMHFHTYDVYKHGKHKIYSRSVGYSSDGDLVMMREDCSEPSDVDMNFTRRNTVIFDPTVLDSRARRPLTDDETANRHRLRLNRPRYRKYPGIHAPRNKKLRNRLMNDYFASEMGMEILAKARARREMQEESGFSPPRPFFDNLPSAVLRAFELKDDNQERELARLGINSGSSIGHGQPPRDPDSAEARLHALNPRLRNELQHALSSEFMSRQIEDLDVLFTEMIKRGSSSETLVFCFQDGYGRLVCHGVAAYYQLVSESRLSENGTSKLTHVFFPKSKKSGRRVINLPHTPLIRALCSSPVNTPARHPLSATNTPQQRPAKAKSHEAQELEPLSPLDLNRNVIAYPSALEAEGNERSCAATAETVSPSSPAVASPVVVSFSDAIPRVNTTVLITENGKLSVQEKFPVYVPQLRLKDEGASSPALTKLYQVRFALESSESFQDKPSAQVEDESSSLLLEGGVEEQHALTMGVASLSATQRRKLKKAEKTKAGVVLQEPPTVASPNVVRKAE